MREYPYFGDAKLGTHKIGGMILIDTLELYISPNEFYIFGFSNNERMASVLKFGYEHVGIYYKNGKWSDFRIEPDELECIILKMWNEYKGVFKKLNKSQITALLRWTKHDCMQKELGTTLFRMFI